MKVKGLEPLGFRKGEKHCLVVSAVVLTGCDGQVSGESVTQCRSRRPARNCPWCDAHCGIPGAEQATQPDCWMQEGGAPGPRRNPTTRKTSIGSPARASRERHFGRLKLSVLAYAITQVSQVGLGG